jgi:hypothetical protein
VQHHSVSEYRLKCFWTFCCRNVKVNHATTLGFDQIPSDGNPSASNLFLNSGLELKPPPVPSICHRKPRPHTPHASATRPRVIYPPVSSIGLVSSIGRVTSIHISSLICPESSTRTSNFLYRLLVHTDRPPSALAPSIAVHPQHAQGGHHRARTT